MSETTLPAATDADASAQKRPHTPIVLRAEPALLAEIDRLALDAGVTRAIMFRRIVSTGIATMTGVANDFYKVQLVANGGPRRR